MKFKIRDLEYTKKIFGNVLSMRSVIEDEEGHIVSTSPFGLMNEKFSNELAACETKDAVIALTDKYFYGRLFEGVCKDIGIK